MDLYRNKRSLVSLKPDIGTWLIQRQPLEMHRTYRVAINDFLMTGKEKGLEFLNLEQTGVKLVEEKRDIRFAVIDQLKANKGMSSNLDQR